jgi:hypothetical protein
MTSGSSDASTYSVVTAIIDIIKMEVNNIWFSLSQSVGFGPTFCSLLVRV